MRSILRYSEILIWGLAASGSAIASAAVVAVPDDFATIQEAVNAAQSDFAPGEVVINSDASFSQSIVITESVLLRAGEGFAPVIEPGGTLIALPAVRIATGTDQASLVTLRGLTIHATGPDAITVKNESDLDPLIVQIEHSTIETVGGDAITVEPLGSIGGTATGSVTLVVTDSVLQTQGLGASASCLRLSPGDFDLTVVVRDSRIRFSAAAGLDARGGHDGRSYTIVADRNIFQGLPSSTYVGSGVYIGGGGSMGSLAVTMDARLTNNLFVGAGEAIGVHGQGSRNLSLVLNNNTVVESGFNALTFSAYGSSVVEATMYNNIIAGSGSEGDSEIGHGLYAGVAQSGTVVLDIDYNLWFDNALGNVSGAALGAHALTIDPQFRDRLAGDYHLTPGSSAIDSGSGKAPGGSGTRDLEGGPREVNGGGPSSTVDRGALEYGWIFVDAFESGDASAWSASSG